MKKLCCFALLLAGCHGVRPFVQTPTPPASQDPGPSKPMAVDGPPPRPVSTGLPGPRPVAAPEEESLPKPEAVRLAEANAALEDAYFAYDRSEISAAAIASLHRDAELLCTILGEFPGLKVIVEGHCDERGSAEYNLGLGESRARRAEDVLREYGVPAAAIEVVSYGKEAPQCTEANEGCWQKNRRAHMAVKR